MELYRIRMSHLTCAYSFSNRLTRPLSVTAEAERVIAGMWCVAVVIVLPSVWVAAVSGLVAAIIVIRTALEDQMLTHELAGYAEYRSRVRWRLVPFLW